MFYLAFSKHCFHIRYKIKCVSKVLGHLSKPAASTSVPGLLRHILERREEIVGEFPDEQISEGKTTKGIQPQIETEKVH